MIKFNVYINSILGLILIFQAIKSFVATDVERSLEPLYLRYLRRFLVELVIPIVILFYILQISHFNFKYNLQAVLGLIVVIVILNILILISNSKKILFIGRTPSVLRSLIMFSKKMKPYIIMSIFLLSMLLIIFFNNHVMQVMNEVSVGVSDLVDSSTLSGLILKTSYIDKSGDFNIQIKSTLLAFYFAGYIILRLLTNVILTKVLASNQQKKFHVKLINGEEIDNLTFVSIKNGMVFFEDKDKQDLVIIKDKIISMEINYISKEVKLLRK